VENKAKIHPSPRIPDQTRKFAELLADDRKAGSWLDVFQVMALCQGTTSVAPKPPTENQGFSPCGDAFGICSVVV
jgi:hypothetical protein